MEFVTCCPAVYICNVVEDGYSHLLQQLSITMAVGSTVPEMIYGLHVAKAAGKDLV